MSTFQKTRRGSGVGGLVPAAIVARELGVRMIETKGNVKALRVRPPPSAPEIEEVELLKVREALGLLISALLWLRVYSAQIMQLAGAASQIDECSLGCSAKR